MLARSQTVRYESTMTACKHADSRTTLAAMQPIYHQGRLFIPSDWAMVLLALRQGLRTASTATLTPSLHFAKRRRSPNGRWQILYVTL
jgi:hypothetical protein